MPLKGTFLQKSLETIKIAPEVRAAFRKRLETLKILVQSKVHGIFWKTKPRSLISEGLCFNVSSYSIERKKSNSA